jgi:hypothetical protein
MRDIEQRMVVAYPMYEPTFPPPKSVHNIWSPPQMATYVSDARLPPKKRKIGKALFDRALVASAPFFRYLGTLPPRTRQAEMTTTLDVLRPGGGKRVDETAKQLIAQGYTAESALRRALAREFLGTSYSPNSRLVSGEILRQTETVSGLGALGSSDWESGLNKVATGISNITCSKVGQLGIDYLTPKVSDACDEPKSRACKEFRKKVAAGTATACEASTDLANRTAPPKPKPKSVKKWCATTGQWLSRGQSCPAPQQRRTRRRRRRRKAPTPWYKKPLAIAGMVGGGVLVLVLLMRGGGATPQVVYAAPPAPPKA